MRTRRLLLAMTALLMSVHVTTSAWTQDEANDEIIQLVVGLLTDADKDMRSLGLEQIR